MSHVYERLKNDYPDRAKETFQRYKRRFRQGAVPRRSTRVKYGVSLEELNFHRRLGGLDEMANWPEELHMPPPASVSCRTRDAATGLCADSVRSGGKKRKRVDADEAEWERETLLHKPPGSPGKDWGKVADYKNEGERNTRDGREDTEDDSEEDTEDDTEDDSEEDTEDDSEDDSEGKNGDDVVERNEGVTHISKPREDNGIKSDTKDTQVCTIDHYIKCISALVRHGSADQYRRKLRILIRYLSGSDTTHMFPYLNDHKRVALAIGVHTLEQQVPGTMLQLHGPRNGRPYARESVKQFWQAVSTGLQEHTSAFCTPGRTKYRCQAYADQLDSAAAAWYTFSSSKHNMDNSVFRQHRNQSAYLLPWDQLSRQAEAIIAAPDTTFEERLLLRLQFQLDAVPLTGTIINLHVVRRRTDACDTDKNYVVIEDRGFATPRVTIVCNDHKTGVSGGRGARGKGKTIVVQMDENAKLAAAIPDILRVVKASKNGIIFEGSAYSVVGRKLKALMQVDNRHARHSKATALFSNKHVDAGAKDYSKYLAISGHSGQTAADYAATQRDLARNHLLTQEPLHKPDFIYHVW